MHVKWSENVRKQDLFALDARGVCQRSRPRHGGGGAQPPGPRGDRVAAASLGARQGANSSCRRCSQRIGLQGKRHCQLGNTHDAIFAYWELCGCERARCVHRMAAQINRLEHVDRSQCCQSSDDQQPLYARICITIKWLFID